MLTRKKYYTVTEVCKKLNVKPHVLRYWEQEFEIKIKRNSAGRRIYSDAQIDKLQLVKHLLRREKLTVKGARRQLAGMKPEPGQVPDSKSRSQALLWLKKELITIRGLLEPDR